MQLQRNISLDILKIILAIFVILLHGFFLKEYNQKVSYLTVNGIFRIAVPIFFIANGYFFEITLNKNNVNNWLKRVLILYSVWMIIYFPFWFKTDLKSTLILLIIGYHHLWYINSMIFCGLFFKVFKIAKQNNILLFCLAILLFIIGVLIQYIGNYHILNEYSFLDKITNIIPTHRNFIFLGLPFFLIGYLIKLNNWEEKINSKLLLILITIGVLLLLLESLFNYLNIQYDSIDNLLSLIFISPFIFIFVIRKTFDVSLNSKKIALISTSMYLIHPWIMAVLNKIFQFSYTIISVITIILAFLLSIVIIKLNTKFKYLL